MLKPIIQNEGATARERYLAQLASSQFFSLWSYPGLSRPGKKGVVKELTDLTVVFGDDILLFSDKDIAWPANADVTVAWGRWFREAVLASAAQLWGAEKYLRTPGASLFLDGRGQVPFPFALSSPQTRIHLIAVASNSVGPARDYFDARAPGSSGTLMHAFGLPEYDAGEQPFVVGDLDRRKPYVHVLDQESLDRLLTELGTIGDFVHYLTEKTAQIRSGRLMHYAGEEDLLAFYLQETTAEGYGSLPFERPARSAHALVTIPEGEWRAFASSPAYQVRSRLRERARGWFELLEPFSTAVLTAQTGEANDTPLAMHEEALRAAASENLASRARLATAFEEKYDTVPAQARSSRVTRSMCHAGRLYVFLFVPWAHDSASYPEYRAFRLQMMHAYAMVAPLKFPGVQEVLVLGAQTHDHTGTRSETMIYVHYAGPYSEADALQARELMTSQNILADVPTVPMSAIAAPTMAPRRYGRNEPCPCGSLKKNKKCCNVSGPRYATLYAGPIHRRDP